MANVEVISEIPIEDLAEQIGGLDYETVMNFLLLVDATVADYGFTAELQAKLQAALRREDSE